MNKFEIGHQIVDIITSAWENFLKDPQNSEWRQEPPVRQTSDEPDRTIHPSALGGCPLIHNLQRTNRIPKTEFSIGTLFRFETAVRVANILQNALRRHWYANEDVRIGYVSVEQPVDFTVDETEINGTADALIYFYNSEVVPMKAVVEIKHSDSPSPSHFLQLATYMLGTHKVWGGDQIAGALVYINPAPWSNGNGITVIPVDQNAIPIFDADKDWLEKKCPGIMDMIGTEEAKAEIKMCARVARELEDATLEFSPGKPTELSCKQSDVIVFSEPKHPYCGRFDKRRKEFTADCPLFGWCWNSVLKETVGVEMEHGDKVVFKAELEDGGHVILLECLGEVH